MHPLYYEYYDKLQLYKNYGHETETILRIFRDRVGRAPTRILDVGCGTGNHAFCFAARGMSVVGMDTDPKIVEVAKRKGEAGPMFVDVLNGVFQAFDLVVSLFNVVNYLEERPDLLSFFEDIRQYLHPEGLLIFDCWNGIAAIRDLPKNRLKQIADLEVEVEPDIDLMRQMVVVHNRVRGPECEFDFSYTHRLWTPMDLTDILEEVGFASVKICQWMRPEIPANYGSWRIMFVCH